MQDGCANLIAPIVNARATASFNTAPWRQTAASSTSITSSSDVNPISHANHSAQSNVATAEAINNSCDSPAGGGPVWAPAGPTGGKSVSAPMGAYISTCMVPEAPTAITTAKVRRINNTSVCVM